MKTKKWNNNTFAPCTGLHFTVSQAAVSNMISQLAVTQLGETENATFASKNTFNIIK
jgi:hypothetical protein